MSIELREDDVKKIESTGLVRTIDCDSKDHRIEFTKAEDGTWKMHVDFRLYQQVSLDDWIGPTYANITFTVPESMVKQYVEAAGGVFEQ